MTGWIVDAVLASALLMAAVLLVRAPVRRLFGPSVAYALWALPALRLVLPPLPESWSGGATPISRAGEYVAYAVVPVPLDAAPEPASWAGLLAVLWVAGAGALLIGHLLQYHRFRRRLLRSHRPVERVDGIRVVLSPAAPGPLAFGVVSRYVALPADLDARYDREERALALAHELGHHARGDLLANWVALAVLAIHWWNPIAWAAHRAFRADQELANDAGVLSRRGADAAHAYACAILKAAHGGAIAAACHLHTVNDLKGRLRMLKNRPASPRRIAAGAATVALVAAAGLGLTASGTSTAAAVKADVGERLGVDLDAELAQALDDFPVPPTPPAPPAPAIASVPAAPPAPRLAASPVPPQVAPVPPTPDTPPVPPAAPVPSVPPVAAAGDHHVWITKDKDGRTFRRYRFLGPNARAFDPARMPDISSRDCGGGERPVVRNETRDGKRLVIICTDRMERMAERHARDAERRAEFAANDGARIQRDALRSALEGLRSARSAIEGNPQLTPEQRREALRGIEEGEREIRESIAQGD